MNSNNTNNSNNVVHIFDIRHTVIDHTYANEVILSSQTRITPADGTHSNAPLAPAQAQDLPYEAGVRSLLNSFLPSWHLSWYSDRDVDDVDDLTGTADITVGDRYGIVIAITRPSGVDGAPSTFVESQQQNNSWDVGPGLGSRDQRLDAIYTKGRASDQRGDKKTCCHCQVSN